MQYYSAAQVRELDRLAIEEFGIPGFELMQRAAKAAFNALLWQWPQVRRVEVFCGGGNNGGDGLVLAALAREAGLQVEAHLLCPPDKLHGSAHLAWEMASRAGVPLRQGLPANIGSGEPQDTVLVDALLGTGLSGPVREPFFSAIRFINDSGLPVLALDIPSGLCSDTGAVLGAAVRATLTITFIGRKLGHAGGAGPAHCGKLLFDALGVPAAVYGVLGK